MLLPTKSVWCLSRGPSCPCQLLISPLHRKKKKKKDFLVEVGGRKKHGIHWGLCMCMCEGPGQLPLLPGMRFARHSHVMGRNGAGRAPGPGIRARERRFACQHCSSRGGAGRVAYLAAPWAGAEGRVSGLGTLGGRQGRARGWGCGALPAGGLQRSGSAGPGTDRGKEHRGAFWHVPAVQAGHVFRGYIQPGLLWLQLECSPPASLERGLGFLHRLRSTTELSRSRQSYTGICVRLTPHICFPRARRQISQLCIRDCGGVKINSQSPSGGLFFYAEKIRNNLKERPARA